MIINNANDFIDLIKDKDNGFKIHVAQNSHPVSIIEHIEFKNLDENLKENQDWLQLDFKAVSLDRFEVLGILKCEVESIDGSIKQISNLKWYEEQLKSQERNWLIVWTIP